MAYFNKISLSSVPFSTSVINLTRCSYITIINKRKQGRITFKCLFVTYIKINFCKMAASHVVLLFTAVETRSDVV